MCQSLGFDPMIVCLTRMCLQVELVGFHENSHDGEGEKEMRCLFLGSLFEPKLCVSSFIRTVYTFNKSY